MSVPAVILCDPRTASLEVAALTVLDRLVVTLHRSGCSPIILVAPPPTAELKRTHALSIEVQSVPSIPAITEPSLVTTTGLLVRPPDVRRLLATGGSLADRAGTRLPIGVVAGGADPIAMLDSLTCMTAAEVACRIDDEPGAKQAERALWASLTSPADGLVDKYVNRPLGRPLSKLLAATSVTPNQVSVFATLLGLASAACFATGAWTEALIGAILLQLSAIIDCIDGDLARIVFKETPIGRWLDLAGDQVVHIAVFVAIAIGVGRGGSDAPVLVLGASAGIGVLISFVVVVRGLIQPEELRNTRLQKLIDATANRDFSALLILLALVGRLDLFMWLTAFGVHVFWIAALAIQLLAQHPPQPARAHLEVTSEKRP